MKKLLFLSILGLSILMASPFGSTLAAESENENAASVLNDYLQAVKNKNVEQMILVVQDDRYDKESLYLQKQEYASSINEKDLVAFEVLDSQIINQNHHEYSLELSFKNGEIVQAPFVLKSKNDVWKVHISDDTLDDADYQVINESAIVEPPFSMATTTRVSWDFSARSGGSTFYSINSFNITGTRASITGSQSHAYPGKPISVTYQVVKKGFFGDTLWGQVAQQTFGAFGKPISGTGNMSNVHMKFKTLNGHITPMGYKGKGSLYQ